MTGRLTEALGGIRIVKSYTAEKREEIVFTHGAHRLSPQHRAVDAGVSATTPAAPVIIGVVGVVMIWMGGNDIVAGRMTLGDFGMYIFSSACSRRDVSIAKHRHADYGGVRGLDSHPRDHEHADEDEADAGKLAGRDPRRHQVRRVWFEYNEGIPVSRTVTFHAAPGTTTRGWDRAAGKSTRSAW